MKHRINNVKSRTNHIQLGSRFEQHSRQYLLDTVNSIHRPQLSKSLLLQKQKALKNVMSLRTDYDHTGVAFYSGSDNEIFKSYEKERNRIYFRRSGRIGFKNRNELSNFPFKNIKFPDRCCNQVYTVSRDEKSTFNRIIGTKIPHTKLNADVRKAKQIRSVACTYNYKVKGTAIKEEPIVPKEVTTRLTKIECNHSQQSMYRSKGRKKSKIVRIAYSGGSKGKPISGYHLRADDPRLCTAKLKKQIPTKILPRSPNNWAYGKPLVIVESSVEMKKHIQSKISGTQLSATYVAQTKLLSKSVLPVKMVGSGNISISIDQFIKSPTSDQVQPLSPYHCEPYHKKCIKWDDFGVKKKIKSSRHHIRDSQFAYQTNHKQLLDSLYKRKLFNEDIENQHYQQKHARHLKFQGPLTDLNRCFGTSNQLKECTYMIAQPSNLLKKPVLTMSGIKYDYEKTTVCEPKEFLYTFARSKQIKNKMVHSIYSNTRIRKTNSVKRDVYKSRSYFKRLLKKKEFRRDNVVTYYRNINRPTRVSFTSAVKMCLYLLKFYKRRKSMKSLKESHIVNKTKSLFNWKPTNVDTINKNTRKKDTKQLKPHDINEYKLSTISVDTIFIPGYCKKKREGVLKRQNCLSNVLSRPIVGTDSKYKVTNADEPQKILKYSKIENSNMLKENVTVKKKVCKDLVPELLRRNTHKKITSQYSMINVKKPKSNVNKSIAMKKQTLPKITNETVTAAYFSATYDTDLVQLYSKKLNDGHIYKSNWYENYQVENQHTHKNPTKKKVYGSGKQVSYHSSVKNMFNTDNKIHVKKDYLHYKNPYQQRFCVLNVRVPSQKVKKKQNKRSGALGKNIHKTTDLNCKCDSGRTLAKSSPCQCPAVESFHIPKVSDPLRVGSNISFKAEFYKQGNLSNEICENLRRILSHKQNRCNVASRQTRSKCNSLSWNANTQIKIGIPNIEGMVTKAKETMCKLQNLKNTYMQTYPKESGVKCVAVNQPNSIGILHESRKVNTKPCELATGVWVTPEHGPESFSVPTKKERKRNVKRRRADHRPKKKSKERKNVRRKKGICECPVPPRIEAPPKNETPEVIHVGSNLSFHVDLYKQGKIISGVCQKLSCYVPAKYQTKFMSLPTMAKRRCDSLSWDAKAEIKIGFPTIYGITKKLKELLPKAWLAAKPSKISQGVAASEPYGDVILHRSRMVNTDKTRYNMENFDSHHDIRYVKPSIKDPNSNKTLRFGSNISFNVELFCGDPAESPAPGTETERRRSNYEGQANKHIDVSKGIRRRSRKPRNSIKQGVRNVKHVKSETSNNYSATKKSFREPTKLMNLEPSQYIKNEPGDAKLVHPMIETKDNTKIVADKGISSKVNTQNLIQKRRAFLNVNINVLKKCRCLMKPAMKKSEHELVQSAAKEEIFAKKTPRKYKHKPKAGNENMVRKDLEIIMPYSKNKLRKSNKSLAKASQKHHPEKEELRENEPKIQVKNENIRKDNQPKTRPFFNININVLKKCRCLMKSTMKKSELKLVQSAAKEEISATKTSRKYHHKPKDRNEKMVKKDLEIIMPHSKIKLKKSNKTLAKASQIHHPEKEELRENEPKIQVKNDNIIKDNQSKTRPFFNININVLKKCRCLMKSTMKKSEHKLVQSAANEELKENEPKLQPKEDDFKKDNHLKNRPVIDISINTLKKYRCLKKSPVKERQNVLTIETDADKPANQNLSKKDPEKITTYSKKVPTPQPDPNNKDTTVKIEPKKCIVNDKIVCSTCNRNDLAEKEKYTITNINNMLVAKLDELTEKAKAKVCETLRSKTDVTQASEDTPNGQIVEELNKLGIPPCTCDNENDKDTSTTSDICPVCRALKKTQIELYKDLVTKKADDVKKMTKAAICNWLSDRDFKTPKPKSKKSSPQLEYDPLFDILVGNKREMNVYNKDDLMEYANTSEDTVYGKSRPQFEILIEKRNAEILNKAEIWKHLNEPIGSKQEINKGLEKKVNKSKKGAKLDINEKECTCCPRKKRRQSKEDKIDLILSPEYIKQKPCICGSTVCKKRKERLDRKRVSRQEKVRKKRPCTCGSNVCKEEATHDLKSQKEKMEEKQIKSEMKALAEKKTKIPKAKKGKKIPKKSKYVSMKKLDKGMLREKEKEQEMEALDTKQKQKRQKEYYKRSRQIQIDKIKAKQRAKLEKRYRREDIDILRSRQKEDKALLKLIPKHKYSDVLLCSDSIVDLCRFVKNTASSLTRGTIRAVENPTRVKENIEKFATHPEIFARAIKRSVTDLGIIPTASRVGKRISKMSVTSSVINKLESNSVTNFMLHFADKDPSKRLKKVRPLKRVREPLDFQCSLYMASLRKRPHWAVYFTSPWFYPHWLNFIRILKQAKDMILMLMAIVVWTPCVVCVEGCRAFVCCFICTE